MAAAEAEQQLQRREFERAQWEWRAQDAETRARAGSEAAEAQHAAALRAAERRLAQAEGRAAELESQAKAASLQVLVRPGSALGGVLQVGLLAAWLGSALLNLPTTWTSEGFGVTRYPQDREGGNLARAGYRVFLPFCLFCFGAAAELGRAGQDGRVYLAALCVVQQLEKQSVRQRQELEQLRQQHHAAQVQAHGRQHGSAAAAQQQAEVARLQELVRSKSAAVAELQQRLVTAEAKHKQVRLGASLASCYVPLMTLQRHSPTCFCIAICRIPATAQCQHR